MRQKYLSDVWSKAASPVSPNIGTFAWLISGAVASASSELGPITPKTFEVVASILLAAGTASAGSPRVSTAKQRSLRPRTPPAELTDLTADSQPAIISGPNDASGPENGLNAITVAVCPRLAAPPDEAQAAMARQLARITKNQQRLMKHPFRRAQLSVER